MANSPRVILFFPKTGWDTLGVTASLPLPLLYLAAPLLQDGFDVQIIDERADRNWRDTLSAALKVDGRGPVCFGVSSMTGLQITHALEACKHVRSLRPEVPIVWGGVHPTLLPGQTLEHPLVDHVIVGEGEYAFHELVKALANGKPVAAIAGLGSKDKDGNQRVNCQGPAVDLDAQPRLPYHLVDVPVYITQKILGERDMIIMTSRGCPHPCTYCYERSPNINNKWRSMTPKRAVDEIVYLRDKYGVTALNFQDDLFFGKVKWVGEVCDEILRRGIENMTFRADCRVDYINGFTTDFMKLFRRAGFKTLFVGVESGSDRILRFIKKNITAEAVKKSVARCKEVDVVPQMGFMAGFPTETMDDVQATLRLMVEVVEIYPKARTSNLQLYTPYPGTELWDFCIQNGMESPKRLEEWATFNWNRTEARWFSPRDRKQLELASYFSYFIDGETVASWYGGKKLLKWANDVYTKIVRTRVKKEFYRFMPEIHAIKYLKEAGAL